MFSKTTLMIIVTVGIAMILFSCRSSIPAKEGSLKCSSKSRTVTTQFQFEDSERSFITYIPSCYQPETPSPLLLFYHGLFAKAEGQQAFTGFSAVAEKYNFIIAYVESSKLAGPNNALKGWDIHEDTDIRFTAQVLKEIKALYSIDQDRIYACGHSLGGRMTMILGSELSSPFSAFCVFAPGPKEYSNFNYLPAKPLPFAIVQGSKDRIISINLDPLQLTATREEIRKGNHAVTERKFTEIAKGAEADYSIFEPESDSSGAPVLSYYIDGMGHLQWPSPSSERSFSTTLDVNELVWKFMSQFHK